MKQLPTTMVTRPSAQTASVDNACSHAHPPRCCSFNIFFSAAAKQNSSASRAAAKKAKKLMSQFGVAPDRVTINAQIDYAIKQGRPDEAINTFERALDGVS